MQRSPFSRRSVVVLLALALLTACSSSGGEEGGTPDGGAPPSPFVTRVVSFSPGQGAGFGQDQMPDIVFGPPRAAAAGMGSLDVVSLGHLGEIVVEMGEEIVDGPGPDLLVFENAFVIGGTTDVFAEPGEVSVSEDGVTWAVFPCDGADWATSSCAGVHPVLSSPDDGLSPTDPSVAGGDPFDLADVGVTSARFVRIRDRSTYLAPPAAGFDLDAIAVVHGR